MRLSDFKFKKNMQYAAAKLSQILVYPFSQTIRKIKRKLNPNGFVEAVVMDVRKEINEVADIKPSSLKDYYTIGQYYAAKKLIYLGIIGILIIAFLILRYGYPWFRSAFLTRTMAVNEAGMFGYSGKVRLTEGKSGPVIFTGRLEEGRINGQGILYDYQGNLIYQGGFQMELYSGYGELYYSNGRIKYRGDFQMNQYQGQGNLYYENGNQQYEGGFTSGVYDGMGKVWREDGSLEYYGGFLSG